MKIAYLAPEIPALSATFVYKEILKLNDFGTDVVPFSVHKPHSEASDPQLGELKENVIHLYEAAKWTVFLAHIYLLFTKPIHYLRTVLLVGKDMFNLGGVSRKAFGLGFRFFYSAFLAKAMIKNQCQHLHIHFAHIPTDIGMYASSLSGISFSVTAHANDLFERGWLLKQKVERSAFFATISEFNKRYLAGKGINTENVQIVRCGVDDEQFTQRENFVPGKNFKVGVVGRLVEKKGIDTLIHAVALMKKKGVDVELYVAGSGPLESELTKLAGETKNISFLGSMAHTDVAKFISSLDAFVLPCKIDINGDMDGIPVVLMEAMLSGVPVISTKVSGIPELVIDEVTGLLVEVDNEEALAAAISRLRIDSELRETMIQGAIEKVSREFSLNVNTQRLRSLFMNVVENS